ncbi:uncharacterized protein [Gossypium hirsutum]|uniref:DUF7745 domain-containing protein n=1 Tax=Gossypium hirsutum TaxID=3635 RepID=A0A1U8L220_GOSHI|nr:uncharacterized protein LOC107921766 [Gossypium hirsutum]
MENEFLSKVEDNAAVRAWSEKLQTEKGDSLIEGYTSELQNFTHIIVDKRLVRGMAQFWNATYNCFTFGEVDLVPTLEEYTTLLRSPMAQTRKIYAKLTNSQTFAKRLVNISGMSESWVTARIQQKGDRKCIPWENMRDLILTHPDEKKRVKIFALSIYGLVIFPKALRHVDEVVTDLFDRLGKGVTPVPAILAETFRSLSMCRKEEIAMQRRDDILEEKWMEILQNLKKDDVEWRAFWMVPDEILYQCGDYNWVPLLGIWRATGYTPLLALRKKVRELSDAWRQMNRMKRLTVGSMVTPEYNGWFSKRVNDNIPRPSSESARPTEERLQITPSELEIIKQDFEKKSSEFRKKIE